MYVNSLIDYSMSFSELMKVIIISSILIFAYVMIWGLWEEK